MTSIAIIGDRGFSPSTEPATEAAFAAVDATWIGTDEVDVHDLGRHDGLYIAPGSPYRSMVGALDAIEVARTAGVPLLGACAGFQHLAIEYARDVLGVADAMHDEYDGSDGVMVVTELACSVVGQDLPVDILPGSVAAAAYGTPSSVEKYYCRFGLAPGWRERLEAGGLVVSGTDDTGEARILELPGHPFFLATLFVPQASAPDHPLVVAFLAAAAQRRATAEHAL